MDRKIIYLVLIVVAASGCTDSTSTGGGGGVQVEEFSIADNTLRPGQQSSITARITNRNSAPTTIKSSNISLFNTGQMQILSKECAPEEIGSREELNPSIQCTWTVEAPGESFVEGFESKPLPIKMRLRYSSTVENSEPLKINFQSIEDIEESGPVSASAGNGDVSMNIESESPSSTSTPEAVTVEVSENGPGQVIGSFNLSCSPSELFDSCPVEKSPIQGEAQFTLNPETSVSGTRNIFISTSYKYEKNPNLDIEVVNN